MKSTSVGILVFPDVEVLDFAGPFEVLSTTRLNEETRYSDSSPFDVFLVAETEDPVVATGGLRVLPAHGLETCPPLDVLVVPGALGTRAQVDNARLMEWIRERATHLRTLAPPNAADVPVEPRGARSARGG